MQLRVRSNVLQAIRRISLGCRCHTTTMLSHSLSIHLTVNDLFPNKLVIIGNWLHERFDQVLCRLNSKNSKYTTFTAYPECFQLGLLI